MITICVAGNHSQYSAITPPPRHARARAGGAVDKYGVAPASGQRCRKAALRFSAKAAMPSFWSCVAKVDQKVRLS